MTDAVDCDPTTNSGGFNWEEAWASLETGSTQVLTKSLALSTQVAIDSFWSWFKRFNNEVLSKRHKRDDLDALKLLGPTEIQLYLLFRLKRARTTKEKGRLHLSTVQGFYKTLQMVYFKYTQMQLPRATNDIINKFIETNLTREFDLLLEAKDKPTCCVTDLYNLLYYHWCQDTQSTFHGRYRIQVAFLMQLIAYTSSRPGSIIESPCYKGQSQVLKYKDMNLSLLRNDGEGGVILVLEMTTTYLKGKRNKREPVTYVLYERRDNLIFCPIMNFLALAFADNVFMQDGIKKPEDLYCLDIPSFKETLSIKWKPEMLEAPVFRRQKGDKICPTTPLAYMDFNHYLKRLGVLSGYPQTLTTYVLRRGAANAVDCPEITDVQRNQIMGHARADVFRRHYLHQTVKVDTQSAYLGTVNRADLIRNIGLMSTKRGPRAPVKLDPEFDVSNHEEIIDLKLEADRLGKSLRLEYGTITASKKLFATGYNAYAAAKRKLNARKRRIERAELEQSRKS